MWRSIPQRVGRAAQRVVGGRVRAAPPALAAGAGRGAAARRARRARRQRHRHQDRGELRVRAAQPVLQVSAPYVGNIYWLKFNPKVGRKRTITSFD